MAADTVQFHSQNEIVVGKFFPANGKATKTILLLHGFPGNPEDVLGLGEKLSEKGFNVFTFNYRGTFESEGFHGLKNSQQDVAAAYSFLGTNEIAEKYEIDTADIILGGYSFGGGMALTYAANNNRSTRVFAIAPTDHGQFARDVQNSKDYHDAFHASFESLRKPNGPVSFEGDDFFTELLENADYYDLRLAVPQLADKDLLLIYGIDDASVTLEDHGLPFYRSLSKAGTSSWDVRIFQDDHSFENSKEELAESITSWLVSIEGGRPESLTQQADFAQQWIRGVYGSNPTVVNELAAEDVVISYPIFQKLFGKPALRGKAAAKKFAGGFCQRWKETRVTFHETIVQDARVVLVWSFRGRNVDSARDGVKPTGQIHEWGGITVIRFDDEGKIIAEIGEESEPGPMGRLSSSSQ